jgi:hypothetical protein
MKRHTSIEASQLQKGHVSQQLFASQRKRRVVYSSWKVDWLFNDDVSIEAI